METELLRSENTDMMVVKSQNIIVNEKYEGYLGGKNENFRELQEWKF